MCTVKKKDGKVCGSWVDKRVSDVCEYHIQNAVQHRRAARPEFTAGTGGMSTSAIVKRKTDYDPVRQWGLKPSTSTGDGATYVISGHVVRSGNKPSLFMAESMGREGQAKAKRRLENNEVENTLKKLLERDREGMEVVLKAREASQAKGDDPKSKGKKKAKVEDDSAVSEFNKPKKAYSNSVIRSLGFDPTLKPGHRRVEVTEDTQSKVLFSNIPLIFTDTCFTSGKGLQRCARAKGISNWGQSPGPGNFRILWHRQNRSGSLPHRDQRTQKTKQ